MDPNFNVTINLAGVPAAGGGSSFTEGYYRGVVLDAGQDTSSGGFERLVLKIGNVEGVPGGVRTARVNIPKDPNDPARFFFRAMMESLAYTKEQIDSGTLSITRAVLVNRPAHFYYKPGDKEAGIWEDMNLITPTDWAIRKASFDKGTQSGAALSTPAPAVGLGAVATPVAQVVAPGIGSGLTAQPAAVATPTPAAQPAAGVQPGMTPDALMNMLRGGAQA